MSFQTALTIREILDGIHDRKYLLPAIQREFVWKPDQISRLFDSLMRSYPIGSFLFWNVAPENVENYAFFDFISEYDSRDPHNQSANVPRNMPVTAILDGQQRLTAFNVALRGSYTEKLPRLHRTNPSAFPKKRLYLNLLSMNDDASPEEAMHSFEFRTMEEPSARDEYWFPVHKVQEFDPESTDVFDYIQEAGLSEHKVAYRSLFRLTQVVHKEGVVSPFLESSDDLDKVLNIFIRVNSAGTQLSYSDLMLSVATAKWTHRDARNEINDLLDEMNDIGQGFSFGKDRILKACLVLGDFENIKFKAVNFKLDNMLQIEKQWDEIASSLKLATMLLATFGLSGETVTAENVLIPVAYYVQRRRLQHPYLTSARDEADRRKVKLWVFRSLLRAGFWTGAVDSILTATREVFREHGSRGFPSDELEVSLAKSGKSLIFGDAEIEDLLNTKYKSRNSFLILSLLYPWVDVSQLFHKDHVFPRGLLNRRSLAKVGLTPEEMEEIQELAEGIPNLQLLPGIQNQEKSKMLPVEWANTNLPEDGRSNYLVANDLDPLPCEVLELRGFLDRRRILQGDRLRQLLESSVSEVADEVKN